jgi:hypothetical protein
VIVNKTGKDVDYTTMVHINSLKEKLLGNNFTIFMLVTTLTYLQQVIEVNQGLLQRFLYVLHHFRVAQPFLYLFVLRICGCRLFLRLGVSDRTADRCIVHLDKLSNCKACSLDEVLVTPEIAFSNVCGTP